MHLEHKNQTVSDIITSYPNYTMIRDKQPLESRDSIESKIQAVANHFSEESINMEDGIKVSFSDSWVHIRPSNTEPIVRIFAEAGSRAAANQLIETIKEI